MQVSPEDGVSKGLSYNAPDLYPFSTLPCIGFHRLGYFVPPLFHPNVFKDGKVCISLLHKDDEEFGWKPSISVSEILIGIQHLLSNPNWNSVANVDTINRKTYIPPILVSICLVIQWMKMNMREWFVNKFNNSNNNKTTNNWFLKIHFVLFLLRQRGRKES